MSRFSHIQAHGQLAHGQLKRGWIVIVLCLLWASVSPMVAAGADDVDYGRDIKPVLKAKCWSCHGALKQESSLRLDSIQYIRRGGESGKVIDLETPLASELLRRIQSDDLAERMPPEGEPVSPEQIARFQAWLTAGAPAPKDDKPQRDPESHWAFQPLNKVVPPDNRKRDAEIVDAFIERRLSASNLKRRSAADAVTLIRRMFLDLHGLPPTPKQIELWSQRLTKDRSKATGELVAELLTSSRYGERWAQHWLDVVRYADTHGFEVNTPRNNAWPYRDYVIRAFNEDKPYDRFVFEQLAGDTVGEDAATGFLVAAAALLPGQIGKDDASKRQARQDSLDEIVVGTTATFLGLTVGCARCHDHKFDPIPQKDYYGLQAFFAGVNYGEREIHGPDRDKRLRQAAVLQAKIDTAKQELQKFHRPAELGRTIIIDDEDLRHVTLLADSNGHGTNPDGNGRGYAGDTGGANRFGNLSRKRYTWWDNKPGKDVFTWNPRAEGRFRLWVSWGVHGSGVHTLDARYVLDLDGNLETRDDQREIAKADQSRFVGQTSGTSEKKPLWSGLLDTGVHTFNSRTRLVLRGGETKTGITADVIVLQEEASDSNSGKASSTLPRLRAPIDAKNNVEYIQPIEARFVRFTTFATNDNNRYQPCIDELEVFSPDDPSHNLALASNGAVPTSSGNYATAGKHQLKHINDGRYGNSFSWISNEFGKGWVQLELPKSQTIGRIEWARDREGKFADRLPVNYQITVSNDGKSWATVASSADRVPIGTPHDDLKSRLRNNRNSNSDKLKSLVAKVSADEKKVSALRKPMKVFGGTFKKPEKTFLLNRGDPEQPTDELRPHALTAIGELSLSLDSSDSERRRTLASWIVSPKNPLAARTIVNRIWQYHFGTGLVETASDFGLNGADPSHPELLDWLAGRFIENGWSIKYLHRTIMASETYGQSSRQTKDGNRIDAANRLLWHFPSRRLEAEAIRDCMLHVSGTLNLKMGGPGFNFFKSRGGLSGFPPIEKFTSEELRRMIYAHRIRMERVPVFGAFDCPDAGLPSPRRGRSTTAIQALNLFNSDFVVQQAADFSERIRSSAGNSIPKQIQQAFQLALGRMPTKSELSRTESTVDQHGIETLCRALFNSSEFLFLP